jgi:hypothetical protein
MWYCGRTSSGIGALLWIVALCSALPPTAAAVGPACDLNGAWVAKVGTDTFTNQGVLVQFEVTENNVM